MNYDKIIISVFQNHNLPMARLIGFSKSIYRENHPKDDIIFNSNIVTKEGKIWFGDLNLTESADELKSISKELGCPLYVLYEMDGRFEEENKSPEELMKKAAFEINENEIKKLKR